MFPIPLSSYHPSSILSTAPISIALDVKTSTAGVFQPSRAQNAQDIQALWRSHTNTGPGYQFPQAERLGGRSVFARSSAAYSGSSSRSRMTHGHGTTTSAAAYSPRQRPQLIASPISCARTRHNRTQLPARYSQRHQPPTATFLPPITILPPRGRVPHVGGRVGSSSSCAFEIVTFAFACAQEARWLVGRVTGKKSGNWDGGGKESFYDFLFK
ncbi:hypothetical protein BJV74DRAFT_950692 [Russula compacta]|nr:hypothetical protein BJV74DRAFT_950692 [Russula compacta]